MKPGTRPILVVEDNEFDAEMIEEALLAIGAPNPVKRVDDAPGDQRTSRTRGYRTTASTGGVARTNAMMSARVGASALNRSPARMRKWPMPG